MNGLKDAESTQSLSHEARVTRVQNRPMFGDRCLFPPQFPRHGKPVLVPLAPLGLGGMTCGKPKVWFISTPNVHNFKTVKPKTGGKKQHPPDGSLFIVYGS